MANQEHLDILNQGVEVWNQWRKDHRLTIPDLSRANLTGYKLSGADLGGVNFLLAILDDADLRGAYFNNADLTEASLRRADLSRAFLSFATFYLTYLEEANLEGAIIGSTIFVGVDLSQAKGLETVEHEYRSSIGIDTIYRSQGNIPEIFLRGAGIDDTFIAYIRSLIDKPIKYYSCFISYSSKDEEFVRRLYADLQSNNVRCWFAPEDFDIGDKIRPRIEESIMLHDKLLLVLSENSIASTWVAYEVERALNKEPAGIPNVLFPIRLDRAVMDSTAGWANEIKSTRHIGDFSNWMNRDDYQKAFSRLLRALKSESGK